MTRVLILMSRTGGGHLASARALSAEFAKRDPGGVTVEIVDFLIDHLAFPINRLPRTYDFLVNRVPWVWKLLWHKTRWPELNRALARAVVMLSRSRIETLLLAAKPDLVISVHPLVNDIVAPVLARLAPATPFATVVTDLGGFHPTWFGGEPDAVFVPTVEAAAIAVAHGRPRDSVHVCGLPVRGSFTAPTAPRAELRRSFGLDVDRPTILVMGGGDGVGPVATIVRACADALASARSDAQLAVVCGRNAALTRQLESTIWPIPVVVHGFVERMAELMQASDLLITKAGPGTIAEATICGLPILLSGFIPGQEEGNVDYVVSRGGGRYLADPKRLAAAVVDLFGPERAALATMAQNSKVLGRPHATADIVEGLRHLLKA